MANICYTQYRVEGPTEQIRKLAGKINEDNQRDFYEGSCRYMLYGHKLKEILPADIRPMNDGWSVLSFEAPSKWVPCWESWQHYARKTVPKAELYYYGEECGCGVFETNDVWHKYFWFDYVTVLRISESTRKDIIKEFAEGAEYREREDQYKEYYKYWDKRELRGALLTV